LLTSKTRYEKILQNKKKDIYFCKLLDVICSELEMQEEELFTRRKSDSKKVTLSIIVYYLYKKEYSFDKIAETMCFTSKQSPFYYQNFASCLINKKQSKIPIENKFIYSFEKIKNKIKCQN